MEILFNFARWPLIMTVVLTLISNGNNLPQWRASQPPATGTIQVAGVRGRIEIRRDRNGGDKFTVNVASIFRWDEYNQLHSAQYRQIVDFNDLGNSRFMIAPGQSGNPYSRHYDDLLKRWQRVEYLPIRVNAN